MCFGSPIPARLRAVAGPEVGTPAPDFELPGTGARTYRLSDYRGKPVILAFYPGDETPVCTRQMCSYSESWAELEGTGAEVLGISKQSVESHEKFRARHDLKVPLLADTTERVVRAYGVRGPFGMTRRAIFLIDADGIVRWRHVSLTGATYRSPDELARRVQALKTPAH